MGQYRCSADLDSDSQCDAVGLEHRTRNGETQVQSPTWPMKGTLGLSQPNLLTGHPEGAPWRMSRTQITTTAAAAAARMEPGRP